MNDAERQDWVNNDESLYRWWRSTRLGITTFVRRYRKEIDEHINYIIHRYDKR